MFEVPIFRTGITVLHQGNKNTVSCWKYVCTRVHTTKKKYHEYDLPIGLKEHIQFKGWTMYRGKIMINDHWSDLYQFLTFQQ